MAIEYKLIGEEDFDSAVECIAKSFCNRDLLSVSLGIGFEDWKIYSKGQVERAIKAGTSIGAFESGLVVGALLSYDFSLYSPKDYSLVDSFIPIASFMDELYTGYNFSENVLHFSYLGVIDEYLNKNIGYNITKKNIGFAREKGFEKIVLEAVPLYTQRVASIFGFLPINELSYKDFLYHGKKIFESIDEVSSCLLMELDL